MLERLPRNKRNIGLAVLAVLILWFAWSIRSVLNPLILGYILAAIVVPIVRGLTRRGWGHRTAVVTVFAAATVVSLLVALGIAIQLRFLVRDLVPGVGPSETEVAASPEPGSDQSSDGANSRAVADGIYDVAPSAGPDAEAKGTNGDGTEGERGPDDAAPEEGGRIEGSEGASATTDGSQDGASQQGANGSTPPADPDRPLTTVMARLNAWAVDALGVDIMSSSDRRQLLDFLDVEQEQLAQAGGRVALGVWSRLRDALGAIFGLSTLVLLVPLYAFFWMFEMDSMHDWIRRHIPERERGRTSRLATQMGEILSRFFRGRLTICIIKGALITVALAVAGIPYSILLGLLAGILSLVPFVGSVVAFALGALVALGTHDPWWAALLITVGIYGAAELVEGYILMPRILGESLGLSEVAVLFAVTAGAASLGLFGVLAALPLAAGVKVLFSAYVDPALTQWADESGSREGESST